MLIISCLLIFETIGAASNKNKHSLCYIIFVVGRLCIKKVSKPVYFLALHKLKSNISVRFDPIETDVAAEFSEFHQLITTVLV
jgi:hypothetical protein